jgi:hypothetical protein
MPNIHEPPAALDRYNRAVAKFITHRATEIRATPGTAVHRMAGALARYWMREARKAAGL